MTPEYLKQFLRNHHVQPNKVFGQNFLLNEIVLQDMVDSVPLKPGEAILEIGPGIGNLTTRLIQTGNYVLSVEKDKTFLPILRELSKRNKNFRFEVADILRFNFSEALAEYPAYHVVANIPYYITGKIFQLLLAAPRRPKTITLLIQKEVAQNLSAKPGNLNVLALSVQLYGEVEILETVKARDFYPAPKVDSAIIRITLHGKPRYSLKDETKFFRIVHACFAGKRKQIHNTLMNNLKLDKAVVSSMLQKAGVDAKARPQELTIEQWIKLSDLI